MWDKSYRDFRPCDPIIKQQVNPGKGLTGCEMHDVNGWGNEYQAKRPRKAGWFLRLFRKGR